MEDTEIKAEDRFPQQQAARDFTYDDAEASFKAYDCRERLP
jgi:hypothetical protein